jgi:signal transduction histidine kinase
VRAVSLSARLVAAVLLVQLAVLLAVMGAVVLDARARNEQLRRAREAQEALVGPWAARADLDTLEKFCAGAEFIEETARWSPGTGFLPGKRGRERTAAEEAAWRAEVEALAARALKAGDGVPIRAGTALLIPATAGNGDPEARFLRFRPSEADLGALRRVYLVLLVGALVSMAVTVLALRAWVLRPLRDVAAGAERVGRGDLGRPVPVRGGAEDEIGGVAAAFNGMMAELAAYRKDLEEQVGQSVRKARDAERTLVTAQRLAAMGTLAAGIAHDINNPLGGMINAVRALRREDLPPEKRLEYLALVEEGLERVAHTVQKVLQFTPHRVAPGPCDLAAVAGRAMDLARHRAEAAGAALAAAFPPGGLPVFGDPWELQQVVLNLLVNAVDAVVETRRGSGAVSIEGTAGEGEVRLLVKDDGVGMTEEQLARAFDLFYTTKEVGAGTGLGLSMVHSTVESHGGRVTLRSRRGEGTTVEVVLPRYA